MELILATRHQKYCEYMALLMPERANVWCLPQMSILSNLIPDIIRSVTDGPHNLLRTLLVARLD